MPTKKKVKKEEITDKVFCAECGCPHELEGKCKSCGAPWPGQG